MRPIEISNDEFTFDFTDSASVRWVHASESSHQESGPHAMEYYIDDETIDRRFGHALDALLADWVDLALACYLADRLATRKPVRLGQSGEHWSRTLNVTLPVRRLDRWTDEIQGSLSRLLSFLSDDSWKFHFVQGESGMRAAESQRFLFSFEHGSPTRVALCSGGLDSFAGAAQTLCDFGIVNPFLFFTKAEMCRHVAVQELGELMPLTSLAMDFPSERRTEVNATPARHVYCGDRPLNWLACRGTTKMDI